MRAASNGASVALALAIGGIALVIPTLAAVCAIYWGSSPADRGYFWGILFLIFMPFTVSGGVGGWLVYAYQRGQRSAPTTTGQKTSAGRSYDGA